VDRDNPNTYQETGACTLEEALDVGYDLLCGKDTYTVDFYEITDSDPERPYVPAEWEEPVYSLRFDPISEHIVGVIRGPLCTEDGCFIV
jgi:hypothetical protein